MTHDPVCPCSGICDPLGEPCSMSGCGCECEGIALGRADEREKAEQRVKALMPERVFLTHSSVAYYDALREAAAAVRGES